MRDMSTYFSRMSSFSTLRNGFGVDLSPFWTKKYRSLALWLGEENAGEWFIAMRVSPFLKTGPLPAARGCEREDLTRLRNTGILCRGTTMRSGTSREGSPTSCAGGTNVTCLPSVNTNTSFLFGPCADGARRLSLFSALASIFFIEVTFFFFVFRFLAKVLF